MKNLLDFLALVYPKMSRSHIKRMTEAGAVEINGIRVTPEMLRKSFEEEHENETA